MCIAKLVLLTSLSDTLNPFLTFATFN